MRLSVLAQQFTATGNLTGTPTSPPLPPPRTLTGHAPSRHALLCLSKGRKKKLLHTSIAVRLRSLCVLLARWHLEYMNAVCPEALNQTTEMSEPSTPPGAATDESFRVAFHRATTNGRFINGGVTHALSSWDALKTIALNKHRLQFPNSLTVGWASYRRLRRERLGEATVCPFSVFITTQNWIGFNGTGDYKREDADTCGRGACIDFTSDHLWWIQRRQHTKVSVHRVAHRGGAK